MVIYIVLMFLIFIYGIYPYVKHNSKQSKKIFLFLAFTSMTVVLGLRGPFVGEDTSHYLNIFDKAANAKWNDMFHSNGLRTAYFTDQYGYTDTIENGFLAICKVVHWFTGDGQVFLFIIAAAICLLFAKFIYDNCEKVFFPTYIFLCESMFMLSFNGIRQILAGAIAIQAYTLLKNGKWKKAILVVLVAGLIHNVALVGFVLFPIMLVKENKESKTFKYAIIATISAPFVIILAKNFIIRLFPRYASYFAINYWENALGGTAILWLVELVLVLVVYRKKFSKKDSFKLSSLILIYLACEFAGLEITMFARVGWFFRGYLMLFFPNAELYFGKKNRKVIRIVVMTLLFLLYFSYARTPARTYQFFWK